MHEIEIADIRKLTEVMKEKYNYDFSNYAMSSFGAGFSGYLNCTSFRAWTCSSSVCRTIRGS
jgi:hypothetical protein